MEKKGLASLDVNSTDPNMQRQIEKTSRRIRSLERQVLGEDYYKKIEENLIPRSLKTSTQYVSSKGQGRWVNTLEVMKTSSAKCPLKLGLTGFVPRSAMVPVISPVKQEGAEKTKTAPTVEKDSEPKATPELLDVEESGGCANRSGGFSWSMLGLALLGCLRMRLFTQT